MIKTPEDLLKFMNQIDYEWMDKNGNFHKDIVPEMYENYSFMSPCEVLKYKKGICVDQTEFERDWFSKNGYEHKVMNIQIDLENESPGHAFLIYTDNGKYYWFENAWYDEKGIHEYNTYEELINDIKNKFSIQNNIVGSKINDIKIFEQPKYPYHISYEEMDEYDSKEKVKRK